MVIDVTLNTARIYNVDTIDIMVGQPFELKIPQAVNSYRWFSDNDEVLSLTVTNGIKAAVQAMYPGKSTILIMDDNFKVQKQLNITVVNEILPEAEILSPVVDGVQPK